MNKRELTQTEVRELLSLEKDDIDLDLIRSYFACKIGQKDPRFNTFDTFTLKAGAYYNKENIKTTIGRYLFNLICLPLSYLGKFGYCNEVLTKGNLGKLEDKMGTMVINDEMPVKDYTDYLDRAEWLTMGSAYFINPTMGYEINKPIKEVIKLRDDLFEKYKTEIKKGDLNTANMIEKEVLGLAETKVKELNNPSYDFFKCGVGSFSNNYKKTSVMAGAIENAYTHDLDILKSNYIDGIDIKEYSKFCNLTVIGGYSRGVDTQFYGANTKKINNSMQTVVIDEPGTDCHTTYYLDIVIPEKMKEMYLYRYILDNGKEILLNEKNIDKYAGKRVKMRSPLFCKTDKICNKCAGELFYKLGIKNAGLLNSSMSGARFKPKYEKVP